MPDEGGKTEMVSYLLGRVRELEAHILQLTERLRAQADKQKNYRRSKKTAARSNAVVTDASQSSNDAVTPLPLAGNAAPSSPSQTLPLLSTKKRITKYSSPLADFIAATWPEKLLSEELETTWRSACPGIDLLASARMARAWQLEDLGRRQRPRALQFLGNWFRNQQQKVRATPPRNGAQLHVSNDQHRAEPAGRKML